ncbi:unnamed protein product [Clonostachys rosea]|uniref:NACHT domain-containing protein n=1 Tax=Bionectria ochroleuca TaxID=29856 RepID=A0ABY6UH09_BIOOC|nr:unnamed protein product [Clonostachys rosea]
MPTQMPTPVVQDAVAAAETVPEDITIAIFCALSCEFTAVKHSLDEKLSCGPNNVGPLKYAYSFGRIGEHKIVIARPHQMGPVEAAHCAATVSQQFPNVRFALMVGIGAGIPNPPKRDIRLGDVAVGIPGDNHPGVLQYDFGKYEAGGRFTLKGFLNKPPAILISADGSLHAEEIEMAESRFLNELERITMKAGYGRPRSKDVLFDPEFPHADPGYDCTGCEASDEKIIVARTSRGVPHVPAVHRGLILSGCGVIKNTQDRNMLSRGYQDAICYEMEAAGIVDEIPCLVIRGICDYADTHKQDGWHYYAAAVAAAYCKAILLKVCGRDAEGQVRMSKEMKRFIGEMQERMQESKKRKALDWLTTTSYGPKQSHFARKRQRGTGQWILSAPEFLDWVQSRSKTLLCTGMPGSGKTILASLVVQDLTRRAANDKTIAVAYIYFSFQQERDQDPEEFLLSLLKQLAQFLGPLPADIKLLYDRHVNKDTRPSWNEILGTIRSVAALHSRIFIVLDALDETSRECRDSFLTHLFNLQTTHMINIFATTRSITEIREQFSGGGMLQIRATDADLRKYLDDRLSKTQCLLMCDTQKIAAISTAVVRAVDGMYILSASLFVESLNSKICLQEVNTALQELETWSGNSGESASCTIYIKMYDQAMKRIMQGRCRELARSVLKWITFAKRPVTNHELRHAIAAEIAFRIGETRINEDFLPTIEFSSVCAGLITVDEETGIIQLVHRTAQEYFQRSQEHWFPNADENIASICVGYLSSPAFEHGPCATDEEFKARLERNPLYDYAARFWGHHARTAPTVHPKMMEFLDKPEQVAAASQALMIRNSPGK